MNTKNKKQQIYPDAEERLRKALERLGTDDPKCAHCGEPNPLLLELHHIAGKTVRRGHDHRMREVPRSIIRRSIRSPSAD